MIKLTNIIKEFKEDLKNQFIILVGIPGSGKTTFLNTELKKYFPQIQSLNITNTDTKLKTLQFNLAKNDFEKIKYITTKEELNDFITGTAYVDRNGKVIQMPLTKDNVSEYLKNGFNKYWNDMYKVYYGSFFRDRMMAKNAADFDLKDKIVNGSNYVVLDTSGGTFNSILKKIQFASEQQSNVVIVCLKIDKDIAIQRDEFRGRTMGRRVGVDIISDYVDKVDKFIEYFKANHGSVNRILVFEWQSTGNKGMFDGYYKLTENLTYKDGMELKTR